MSTPAVQNLIDGNKAYVSTFTEGHLALPPSQKYAVGQSHHS
jgi:carbonic anhydrase